MFRTSFEFLIEWLYIPGYFLCRNDKNILSLAKAARKQLHRKMANGKVSEKKYFNLHSVRSPVKAPLPMYLAVYLNNNYCRGALVGCALCIARLIEYANLNVVFFAFYFFPATSLYIWIFIRIIFPFVSVKHMQNSRYVSTTYSTSSWAIRANTKKKMKTMQQHMWQRRGASGAALNT